PVGIVVVGHGRIAAEMVDTLTSVVGDLEAVEGVACTPTDDQAAVRARVLAAIGRVDRGAGVVVLTDMLGDTASNATLSIAREKPELEMVAGVNMPMLLKLTTCRCGPTAADLAETLRRYGQEHILHPTRGS
ncbi:MAG: PTS sugar transporter subunit IIA, partial [Alphaproteobacteria bacterium]